MKITTKMFSSINYRSLIVGFVMCVSILAFLFTGFGRLSFKSFKGIDPNMALTVGKQTVDMSEFSNLLTQRGFSNSMPDNQKKYLISQVLDDLIYQKLFIEQAQKMGFSASQNDIASFVRTIKGYQDPTTGQFSLERLKQYIASQQMTDVEFYQKIQNELTMNNLGQLVFLSEIIPVNVAKTQYIIDHTEFNLQYALVNVNPTYVEEQVQTQVDEFLKNPENQKTLEDSYNSKKAQFTQQTQYKVRSILISYKDATRAQGAALQRDKLQAQQLIDELLNKVQNGANFSTLAAQTNDDIQAKQNKGDLGYLDDTKIDPTSYEALTNLSQKKPLSSVVDTPFGFRIFKLEDKKEGFSKSFDEVKNTLAQDILTQKLRGSVQTDFNHKVNAALVHAPDAQPLDILLQTQGIVWKSADKPFTIKDNDFANFGSPGVLVTNVFSLKNSGDVIPKILDFGSSKQVIVKLMSVRKPNDPTEADIKVLQKQESEKASQQLFQAYARELKASYEAQGKIKINPVLSP